MNDVKPLIPLLIECLQKSKEGGDSQDINTLKHEVEEFFIKMFETFGHDKVKKDIELIVINNQRLYDIFFTWFYSNGFVSQDSRPKTTKGDFLHASKNSEFLDLEEEDKSYSSPIARPKTTQAIIQQREERKDDEFDLSPSQSASHKGKIIF